MNSVQTALTAAADRLKSFKAAHLRAKEVGGWKLDPQEFWEPADDAALEAIEKAQAELRGERPLFEGGLNG